MTDLCMSFCSHHYVVHLRLKWIIGRCFRRVLDWVHWSGKNCRCWKLQPHGGSICCMFTHLYHDKWAEKLVNKTQSHGWFGSALLRLSYRISSVLEVLLAKTPPPQNRRSVPKSPDRGLSGKTRMWKRRLKASSKERPLGRNRGVASLTPGTPKFWDPKMYTTENGWRFQSIGWFLFPNSLGLEKDGWLDITMSIHLNLGLFWGSKMIIESESRSATSMIITKILTHFDISGIFNFLACFFCWNLMAIHSKMVYPTHVGRCRM